MLNSIEFKRNLAEHGPLVSTKHVFCQKNMFKLLLLLLRNNPPTAGLAAGLLLIPNVLLFS